MSWQEEIKRKLNKQYIFLKKLQKTVDKSFFEWYPLEAVSEECKNLKKTVKKQLTKAGKPAKLFESFLKSTKSDNRNLDN